MTAAWLMAMAVVLMVLAAFLSFWWLSNTRDSHQAARRIETQLAVTDDSEHDRWWNLFSEPGRKVDSWFDEDGETEHLMHQAGLRTSMQRGAYFAAQALLPVIGVGIVVLLLFGGQISGAIGFVYGFGAACLSLLAPRIWLRKAAQARKSKLRGEVAMFIHLLALLFDAGLSLRQALASLVREGAGVLPALGVEIRLVLRQLEAGAEPGEALHAMGRDLDVAELNAVLGVLRQVDRYGGELREPLMDALAVIEERRQLTLREKVNALSGRMTVVMVMFFFPALLIFVAGPAFLSIVRALGGQG